MTDNNQFNKTIMTYCSLTENQYRMVLIWFVSFMVQATILYFIFPKKFDTKWFLMCMMLNVMYNISFFKLFSD